MAKAITITPLYEKKRELELEINRLKERYERDERTSNELAESITDATKRLQEMEAALAELEKHGSEVADFALATMNRAADAVRAADETLDLAFRVLTSLETAIDAAKERLAAFSEDEARRRAQVEVDEQRLTVREEDLNIYKKRLQAKYAELNLGELIL